MKQLLVLLTVTVVICKSNEECPAPRAEKRVVHMDGGELDVDFNSILDGVTVFEDIKKSEDTDDTDGGAK